MQKRIEPPSEELDINVCTPVLTKQIVTSALQEHIPHLTEQGVLNFYVYGSRLYGTATQDSDYDTLVILSDEAFTNKVVRLNEGVTAMNPQDRKTGFIQSIQNGLKLDMTTYSYSYYLYRLNRYSFHEFLQIWCPVAFKCESFAPIDIWATRNEEIGAFLELPLLRSYLTLQAESNWKNARRFFQDGLKHENEALRKIDVHKGKKGLISALRMYHITTQLAQFGHVVDWGCANEYMHHEWTQDENMQDYDQFYNEFNKIRIVLRKTLAEVVPESAPGVTL
jgi:hypothetical protein